MKFRKDDRDAKNPPDESTSDKAAREATEEPSTGQAPAPEPGPGPHNTSNERTPAPPQPGERTGNEPPAAPQRAPTQRMRATQTVLYQGLPYFEGQEFNAQMVDVDRLRSRYKAELISSGQPGKK